MLTAFTFAPPRHCEASARAVANQWLECLRSDRGYGGISGSSGKGDVTQTATSLVMMMAVHGSPLLGP